MRPRRNGCERLLVRLVIKSELQHADRLAATRHGSEDAESSRVSDYLNLLLRERATVWRAGQRDCLAAFAVYVIGLSVRAADMAQPD